MILFHEGQLEGRMVRVPVQLGRRPNENPSPILDGFYKKLLECLSSEVFREGAWSLLAARPAWHDNSSWENFLCFWWELRDQIRFVVVNYSPNTAQCYVPLPVDGALSRTLEFRDLMGPAVFYREARTLSSKGMFFDLPGYSVHIFDVRTSA